MLLSAGDAKISQLSKLADAPNVYRRQVTSVEPPMAPVPKTIKPRGPAKWIDRRLLRSGLYALLLVILFLLFTTTEWLVEHFLSASKDYSLIVALSIAIGLAIVFQMFHKRIEHGVEGWLHHGLHERQKGLTALTQEITLIRERGALEKRVIERLDQLLATEGAALYLNQAGENFQLAYAAAASHPGEIAATDPAVIHLRLQRASIVPRSTGSSISAPLVWPIHLRDRLIGFIASGERRHKESFDEGEIHAVGELAKTLGTALALIDPALADRQTRDIAERTNNLPQHLTPLIGREAELAEVKELMGTTSLLTLVGAGGMGKTRFSLEVASDLLDRFKDGVWFIELAPVSDPALVSRTVAEVLGVHEEAGRPLLDTFLEFLRRRNLLLVLDNCEHLIEGCARFAAAALRASSGLRILASSREALDIAGELAWRMPPLPTPNAAGRESGDQLLQYSAVRLFVARAAFASPSFRLTADNSAAVARICRQLDGIPLALELAAARVKAMRVEQIAERLDDRFQLLTSGNRTALPRQQTLRSAIDWSHDLLNDPERVLLRRLSVFAGGWTLEAAEAVCAGDGIQSTDALDLLTRLVDKSLVVPDETAAEPRYRMLETIRQYSREKLVDANEVEQIGDRHLTFFTRQAEWLEPRFYSPDQVRWYAKAEVELDNIRAAVEHSLLSKRVSDGMRLVNALNRYWVARVYWREANGWWKRLLAVSGTEDGTPLRARTLFVTGQTTNYYDPTEARIFAEDSLRLSRSLDYKEGIINALWLMGWLNYPKLDAAAAPYFEESIELARAIDQVYGAAHAYAWYGVYKIGVGDYEGAKSTLREGMVQAERIGDYFATKLALREGTLQAERIGGDATLIGRCAGNLGLVAMLQGDFVAAKSYLDQSLALVRGADNRNSIAETLWLQGRLALRQNDFDSALYHFKESLALYRTYTTSVWVTRDLVYIAILHVARDQFAIAAQLVGALDARDKAFGSINAHLASRASIAEYQSAVEKLKAKMPATTFHAEWQVGHNLDIEQSIELALS
jgi:predicted ATPase